MKKAGILIAFTLISVCLFSQAGDSSYRPLLVASETFSSGGRTFMRRSEVLGREEAHKVEAGEVNGVAYRFYYTDGGGVFSGSPGLPLGNLVSSSENWSTACKKDPISDLAFCFATLRDLTIMMDSKGGSRVRVGNSHYPGSDVVVRIARDAPFVASSDGQFDVDTSRQILEKMTSGAAVTTRYRKWPETGFRDQVFELYGVEEVASFLRWAVEHIE